MKASLGKRNNMPIRRQSRAAADRPPRGAALRRLIPWQRIRGYCNAVAREFRPDKILLFGSYAYGHPSADSDVDLLVILPFRGSDLKKAVDEGVDTFITGEGSHWTYALAEELEVNVLYGGHYATETFGVKALAAHLSSRFKVPWAFIHHPTGL